VNNEDTSLNEAIVSDAHDVCSVHGAMSAVLTSLSRRMLRLERLLLTVLAVSVGLLGKDLLLPVLLKIIAP